MAEPSPGEIHAGCQLERLLGRGGMGSVYLARDRAGEAVVVKFLAAEMAEKPLLRQRFQREWDALRKIHPHPNVVRVLDVRGEGQHPCLTMEFAPGTPLDALLRDRRRLPPAQAAQIARDMARGLAAVHAHGLIHRDVKPANAILGEDGCTRLVDFGLAKDLFLSALTKPGELLGTAHYMAPEQWEGSPVDARTDVFALGATLYHLVCGQAPFEGDDPDDIADECLAGDSVRPREHVPSLPPELELVILRALMTDPRYRYPRMTDLADDLEGVLAGEPARVPSLIAEGRRVPLIPDEWITVGSGPGCALTLAHPSLAPKHAQLRREDNGFVVFDFNSPSGTFVAGERVVANRVRPLRHGDAVRFGEVAFTFSDPLGAGGGDPEFLQDATRRETPLPVVEALAAQGDPQGFLFLLERLTPDRYADQLADRDLAALLGPEAARLASDGRRRASERWSASIPAALRAMTTQQIAGDPAQWLGWWHQVRTTAPAQAGPAAPARDLRLRVTAGLPTRVVLPLGASGVALLGRDPRCQLRFDLATAPRLHATLLRLHARWIVADEGSPSGTRLNGRPVRWAFVDPGDTLTLGPVTLVVEATPPPGPEQIGPRLTVVDAASFDALAEANHPATCAGLVGLVAEAASTDWVDEAGSALGKDAAFSAAVRALIAERAAHARARLVALLGHDAGDDPGAWQRVLETRRSSLPAQVLPRGWLAGTRP